MKLLIASDIHGSAACCTKLLERADIEAPDTIVLLGDLLYHGPRNALPEGYNPAAVAEMLNARKERIVAVRGNCEAEVDQMVLEFPCMADYAELYDEEGRIIYATHGHLASPDALPVRHPHAFLSGHTHVKMLEERNGVLCVNPGSVSIPKDGSHSYAVYENGIFTLKTLDGEEIASAQL